MAGRPVAVRDSSRPAVGRARTPTWARARRCAGVALLLLGIARAVAAAEFEYLHVEANEGGSSGGHAAVRFGDEVFHFQHQPGGVLHLRRDEAATFALRYALLENRPIHAIDVAVSDQTAAALRDGFAHRLQEENAQFARLDALRADVGLFALWRRRALGGASGLPPTIPVRAAGYFLPDGFGAEPGATQPPSALLDRLRARVAALPGGDLSTRIAALRAALAGLDLQPQRAPDAIARHAYPIFAPTASTRYAELLERLTALEILAAAPSLRAPAARVAAAEPPLDETERRALSRFADDLIGELAALPASRRSDWGYPLLLGMARLAAIEQSLADGRLVVLDVFPPDAPAVALPTGAARAGFFAALDRMNAAAVARARAELFAQPRFREADYAHFEAALNRRLEADRAQHGAPLRAEPAVLLPAWPARRADLVVPAPPAAMAVRDAADAEAAEARYRAALADLYGYDLLTRNCVTELFVTIDESLVDPTDGGDRDAVERAQRERMGGVVETRGTLAFIPFLSATAVERNYAAVGRRLQPSYRQRRVAALTADEAAWRVWLRESNTLTATAYRPGVGDSAFLFFTDDSLVLRPLFGAANLLVGVGDGLLGLATWPLDGGRRVRAGARGALFSLPELGFVNLRKGTTAYVLPEEIAAAR